VLLATVSSEPLEKGQQLLYGNMCCHIRFSLIPKKMTLNDLEMPFNWDATMHTGRAISQRT